MAIGSKSRAGKRNIAAQRRVNSEYIYGNTAKELRELGTDTNSAIRISHQTRRNRERAGHMSPAYVFFLTLAMALTVLVCIQYLMLRSEVTGKVKEIASLETQLNELKAENDDTENRIKGAVDLEEIKYRAMNELGMQSAGEDQIVSYECEDTDYVRQLVDIE